MAKQPHPKPKVEFVDRPEVSETFADSLRTVTFDGQTMRIDFCVSRVDKSKAPDPPTIRQYPACRLVLTPEAGFELFKKLEQLLSKLEEDGVIKKMEPPIPGPPKIIQ